nr:unnamed protein product [Digitaria exilis]
MPPPKPLVFLLLLLLVLVVSPASCSEPNPVLALITKDPTTSLYTTSITPGTNLLVDLAGPLIWSTTCEGGGRSTPLSCQDPACKLAGAYLPPGCRKARHHQHCHGHYCTAYPYNPFTPRQCAAGELSRTTFASTTIDATNTLRSVSLTIVASCAPRWKKLLPSPAFAAGVAGLSSSGLALPPQAAAGRNARDAFFLCLPSSGRGAALLGAATVDVLPPELQALASSMAYAPLVTKRGDDPAYYLPVKGIAVGDAAVALPSSALAAGVMLSTLAPYTELRSDVYRALVDAFDRAMGRDARVSTPAGAPPFELCYSSSALLVTKVGYQVPYIDLTLAGGGRNWTMLGSNC